jgi:hypothetical protein
MNNKTTIAKYLIFYKCEDKEHGYDYYGSEIYNDPAEWAIAVAPTHKLSRKFFIPLSIIPMTEDQAKRWEEAKKGNYV